MMLGGGGEQTSCNVFLKQQGAVTCRGKIFTHPTGYVTVGLSRKQTNNYSNPESTHAAMRAASVSGLKTAPLKEPRGWLRVRTVPAEMRLDLTN